MEKVFILLTDDEIDHMLYHEARDEVKRCNAEILRLRDKISRLSDLQAVADKLAERLKGFRGWQAIEIDKEEITLNPKDLFDAKDAEALSAYEKLMEQK